MKRELKSLDLTKIYSEDGIFSLNHQRGKKLRKNLKKEILTSELAKAII